DLLRSTKPHGTTHTARGVGAAQDERGGAVGYERAVGAAKRTGNDGILLRHRPAKVIAEILAQVRVGVLRAITMVLGRDAGQRVRLVAVAIEIRLRDAAEHASKAAGRARLLARIRAFQEH